jgi:transcriptional regulator with XRE-family HTH domain
MGSFTLSIPQPVDVPARLRFARRVVSLLLDNDITRSELAQAADVSKQRYGQWERAGVGPTKEKLELVAQRLGVESAWLAWGTGAMFAPPEPTSADAGAALEDEVRKRKERIWQVLHGEPKQQEGNGG